MTYRTILLSMAKVACIQARQANWTLEETYQWVQQLQLAQEIVAMLDPDSQQHELLATLVEVELEVAISNMIEPRTHIVVEEIRVLIA